MTGSSRDEAEFRKSIKAFLKRTRKFPVKSAVARRFAAFADI